MIVVAIFQAVLDIALVIHIVLLSICVWRIWSGESVIDRLIGFDAVNTLMLAVLVIISLSQVESLFLDVALAMAALGFIALVALSKYLADDQMF